MISDGSSIPHGHSVSMKTVGIKCAITVLILLAYHIFHDKGNQRSESRNRTCEGLIQSQTGVPTHHLGIIVSRNLTHPTLGIPPESELFLTPGLPRFSQI